jgi:sirohydrochlorin cobaltochelatase
VSRLKRINAHVLVCTHKTCRKQGGRAALKELKRAIKEQDLRASVLVTRVKCLDQCGRGPVMVVYPDGVWYGGVDAERARAIVSEHLAKGRTAACAKFLRDMREAEQQQQPPPK